ncbi:MAG: SRPBCC family protein [Alphaproteobacteria bacterium]|nr:SRPBCC family protein [Alphaproteobacteria bacterium]
MRGVASLTILLSALLTSAASAGMKVGAAEEAKLAAGEVLVEATVDEGQEAARVSAVIDIAAPPRSVWSVMTDCARAPRFLPGLISCRVLESDPGGAWDIREHVVDWAWYLPTVRNVFRSDYEPPTRLRFKRTDGDLARSEGEWRLESMKGGAATRLSYTALLSPRSWIPPSLALSSVKEDVPNVLLALRGECIASR